MTRKNQSAEENTEAAVEEKTTEAATEEAATEEEKKAPKKRKHALPEGWITPVAFRHALVERELAGDNLSSAQIYILSRKAASNGMPVKHFNAAGEQFDDLQVHPITGETLTRPGLKLDEGLDWWQNRPKRQPGQKKEKAEKAEGTAEAEAENLEDAAAGESLEDELEQFVEAE
jgi:hypothetical protein